MEKEESQAKIGTAYHVHLAEEERQQIREILERSVFRAMSVGSAPEERVARARYSLLVYRDPPGVCEMVYF